MVRAPWRHGESREQGSRTGRCGWITSFLRSFPPPPVPGFFWGVVWWQGAAAGAECASGWLLMGGTLTSRPRGGPAHQYAPTGPLVGSVVGWERAGSGGGGRANTLLGPEGAAGSVVVPRADHRNACAVVWVVMVGSPVA